MQFGTGSTTELTQKNREGQSTKMPCVRPYIYTNKHPRFFHFYPCKCLARYARSPNKQTSPIFNCVTPISVSLANNEKSRIMIHSMAGFGAVWGNVKGGLLPRCRDGSPLEPLHVLYLLLKTKALSARI